MINMTMVKLMIMLYNCHDYKDSSDDSGDSDNDNDSHNDNDILQQTSAVVMITNIMTMIMIMMMILMIMENSCQLSKGDLARSAVRGLNVTFGPS